MQDNANNYGFGRMSKDLFGNEVDNNSINGIDMYPYENYNEIVRAELELHKENLDNPHQVTCNQIKAVSLDVDQTSIIDSTEKAVARKNIGLDRVQNTSDTDEPILNSDLKFTSGGAYQLKQATIDEFKISRAVEAELTLRADKADSEIKQIKEDIDVNVSELKELIDTEKEERTEADSTINTRITNEVNDLNNRIDNEVNIINDRINLEVETLNTTIDNLDEELTNNINQEIEDRIADVDAEELRATTKENEIVADLAAETTRATGAEEVLTTNLAAEVTRATDEEGRIDAKLDTEISDRMAAVNAEETRATETEAALDTKIDGVSDDLSDEVTARQNADSGLQQNIDNEATARSNADNTLQDNIDSEATARQNADTSLSNKINSDVHVKTNGDEFAYDEDTVTKTSHYKNLNTGETSQKEEVILLATDENAGMMSPTDHQQIWLNKSRIDNLEGKATRLMYSEKANPSANEIKIFVDNYLTQKGISPITEQDYAGVSVIVEETSHVWYYYFNNEIGWHDDGQDTVSQFTNEVAGIIKGTNSDGFVFAENNGNGSVKGWSELKTRVSNLEINTVTNINYNTTTKTIDKTINGTTTNVVSADTLKQDMNLDSVVNTGDSDTPVLEGITKFTTGGAYTLKNDLEQEISDLSGNLSTHIANTSNPHNVTKSQIGLDNVDNTSDIDKPISTATQSALDIEKNERTTADKKLQDNLDTEVERAIVSESILEDKIDSEIDRATTAETSLENSKQNTLVSGENIKTINNESILGSGNISISSGDSYTAGEGIDITNNVISVDNTIAKISDLPDAVSGTTDGTNWTSLTIGSDTYGLDGGTEYTAGNGIDITNDVISIDNTVALKSDVQELDEQKQDVLTASTGINIDNSNNIKVIGSEYKNSSGTVMGCLKFVKLTQAQYNALSTKDSDTMYIIVG